LRHPAGQQYPALLASQLLALSPSPQYQDTVLYCKNGEVMTNRLLIGLLHPVLAPLLPHPANTEVHVILEQVGTEEVQTQLDQLLLSFSRSREFMQKRENTFYDGAIKEEVEKEGDVESQWNADAVEEDMVQDSEGEEDNINDENFNPDVTTASAEEITVELEGKEYKMAKPRSDTKSSNVHSCDVCQSIIKTKSNMNRHLKSSHGLGRSHECNTLCYYDPHVKSSGCKALATCDICSKAFPNKSNLTRHLRVVHSQGTEHELKQCDFQFCEFTYKDKEKYINHLRSHKTGQLSKALQIDCYICDKHFFHSKYLKAHMLEEHNTEKNFKCKVCDYTAALASSIKAHEKTHAWEEKNKVSCHVCGKVYNDNGYLDFHMKHVHGEKEAVKCDQCGATFKSEKYLSTHINTIHCEDSRVHCDHCGLQVRRKRLKTHQLTHAEPTFKCEICGQFLHSKSSWKAHVNAHKKSFGCEECGLSFKARRSLKLHIMKIHDLGLKPSKFVPKKQNREGLPEYCTLCDFKASKKGLITHMARQHGIGEIFTCQHCPYTTPCQLNLKRHTEGKHEGKEITCHLCEYKTKWKNSMKNHKLLTHNVSDTPIVNDM